MPIKPKFEERVERARSELLIKPKTQEEVIDILKNCISEKRIQGEVVEISFDLQERKIDYENISQKYGTNGAGHIIWIQFANTGHVAVVGAGKDIGFPMNSNKGTCSILKELKDVKWDKSKVIVIPVKGLDRNSYGLRNIHKYGNNVLKCRNGVEHYIGEYLVKNGVPILNYYQHINYSASFWDKCEKNNYIRD